MQTTSNILMIRPSGFGFNQETAGTNDFQKKELIENAELQNNALEEFNQFEHTLKTKGIHVYTFDDNAHPVKPDAIFPNNWVSFHEDGTVVLYPMLAANRRKERRMDIIDSLRKNFLINNLVDLSIHENERTFLEGTGSIVYDHENRIAYAALSARTNKKLFVHLCEILNYTPVYFSAFTKNNMEVYHTNVMMCIAEKFAVVCLQAIPDHKERKMLYNKLSSTGHIIIDIEFEQMALFSGNMLAVKNKNNTDFLVLSESAFTSLTAKQKEAMNIEFLPVSIYSIEHAAGGSARCMMAEIFLPEI